MVHQAGTSVLAAGSSARTAIVPPMGTPRICSASMMMGMGHLRPSASMTSIGAGPAGLDGPIGEVMRLASHPRRGSVGPPMSRGRSRCLAARPGKLPDPDRSGATRERYPHVAAGMRARPRDRRHRGPTRQGVLAGPAPAHDTVSTTVCRTSYVTSRCSWVSSAGKATCESHPQCPTQPGRARSGPGAQPDGGSFTAPRAGSAVAARAAAHGRPRRLPYVVLPGVQQRRPGRDHVGLAVGRRVVRARGHGDGGDRVLDAHGRRPVLLGVQARRRSRRHC